MEEQEHPDPAPEPSPPEPPDTEFEDPGVPDWRKIDQPEPEENIRTKQEE
jgi:hypothetical protein